MVRHPDTLRRRSVTYEAVVQAVMRHAPAHVLDLGCGEGWLCRALGDRGVACLGLDGSPALIEEARAAGGGRFEVLRFQDLAGDPAGHVGGADLIVANFSFLDEQVPETVQRLGAAARPGARLIIQAAHPLIGAADYRCGWRMEHFDGHQGEDWRPMPWYFRTLSSWLSTLPPRWRLERLEEPAEAEGAPPASLLLTAMLASP